MSNDQQPHNSQGSGKKMKFKSWSAFSPGLRILLVVCLLLGFLLPIVSVMMGSSPIILLNSLLVIVIVVGVWQSSRNSN